MATNLYQVLGLDRNASPEDIRKAYRRKALQTHPDRLPPGMSSTEKTSAEEQFRQVNNAYEVLNDTQNRKLYDQFGVWPPPDATPDNDTRRRHTYDNSDPFLSDPFFTSPFGGFGSSSRRGFTFTDPFELFNSLLGDLHRHFDDNPLFADAFPPMRSPLNNPMRDPFGSPFSPFGASPFGASSFGLGPRFLGPSLMNQPMRPGASSYSSITRATGQNGQWVSQSQMQRTINGRTETITTRRDAQGNEHVVYSSPEGERYTLNGVEQPRDRALPSEPYAPPQSSRSAPHPVPANSYVQNQAQTQVPVSYTTAPPMQTPQPAQAQYPYPAQSYAPPPVPPVQPAYPERRSSSRPSNDRVRSRDGVDRHHDRYRDRHHDRRIDRERGEEHGKTDRASRHGGW